MKRIYIAGIALAMTLAGATFAADPAPKAGPGWTGLTEPEKVIEAREALMVEIERIMRPLDSYTIGEPADPEDLRSIAQSVSQMLLALPHLFPPTTNLYDAKAETPKTLALPPIWQNFAGFEKMAEVAELQAEKVAKMKTPDELKAGALALRATCDACHAVYLRPYVPSTVKQDDVNFDFDSAFKKK
ncbi:MAG: cytochrome c [Gammaproteobacteria bacterium]